MSADIARDVAHVLTVYGLDDEDAVQFDLECTAPRRGHLPPCIDPRRICLPLCGVFIPCGCVDPVTVRSAGGDLCLAEPARRHWWRVVDGQPATWVTLTGECCVAAYDDLYEAVDSVVTTVTRADGDPRGRWALTWLMDDAGELLLEPLARLGTKPCIPKAQTWTPNAVPTIDRFPAAGLEADVRDLIEGRVFVNTNETGLMVDACDATLAVLARVREERGQA